MVPTDIRRAYNDMVTHMTSNHEIIEWPTMEQIERKQVNNFESAVMLWTNVEM